MSKSRLRDETEHAVFIPELPEVAKQHEVHVFAGLTAFGVLVSAHGSFWLDKNNNFKCFHEKNTKPAFVPSTV